MPLAALSATGEPTGRRRPPSRTSPAPFRPPRPSCASAARRGQPRARARRRLPAARLARRSPRRGVRPPVGRHRPRRRHLRDPPGREAGSPASSSSARQDPPAAHPPARRGHDRRPANPTAPGSRHVRQRSAPCSSMRPTSSPTRPTAPSVEAEPPHPGPAAPARESRLHRAASRPSPLERLPAPRSRRSPGRGRRSPRPLRSIDHAAMVCPCHAEPRTDARAASLMNVAAQSALTLRHRRTNMPMLHPARLVPLDFPVVTASLAGWSAPRRESAPNRITGRAGRG